MHKVLILGGGFGGLETAICLRREGMHVTLVSERDYFFIYPTSIWIPTGESAFSDVCIPLEELKTAHGFELIIDEVTAIRSKEKKVQLKNGGDLDYEYLVVAIGAGKMNHPGIENTLSICGAPQQSSMIKERMDALIAKGSGKIALGFGGNPKDTSGVRGGPAFEVLFNVHNLLKKKKLRDRFELTFFAPMESPGARMGPQALKMMDIFFSKLNINKHFGKKIKRFEQDGIVFADDSKLPSDLTMFIPAGDGHPVIKASDLPLNDAGFVRINDYCEVDHDFDDAPENYNVLVVGDAAALDGPDWRAKQGHIAEVMARNTAYNIVAMERGETHRRGYFEHLNILCVMDTGNGAAFVYRDDKRAKMIPLPVVGHWLKKGWGWYFRNSKLRKIPRIPGM